MSNTNILSFAELFLHTEYVLLFGLGICAVLSVLLLWAADVEIKNQNKYN